MWPTPTPDDIMLSTYEDDGSSRFDAITKEISPLTAYCLGPDRHLPRAWTVPPAGRLTPCFPRGAEREAGVGPGRGRIVGQVILGAAPSAREA